MNKRSSTILFLAWASCLTLSAQTNNEIREQYKPGKLETFLTSTPNASLAKKTVGTLPSSTSATLTAIVAADPASKTTVGGLELRFSGEDVADSVYLDEDCVVRLQKSLESLKAQAAFELVNGPRLDSADVSVPQVVVAYNDYSTSILPDGQSERAGILALGFYRYGGRLRVYLAPTKSRPERNLQFYFPEATLTELCKFFEDAQAFLRITPQS